MADTENSIEEQGIPEIRLEVTALNTTQNAVDPTLYNQGEAADAKAAGDRIRALESGLAGKNAETLYMDDEDETEDNTIAAVIGELKDRTGDDIPVGPNDARKLSDIAEIVDAMHPVGSVIITTSSTAPPSSTGTWTEILVPLTWADAKNGHRSYTAGTGTGTLHFWLRTA